MNISNHHCPWSPVFQPFSHFLRYSAPNFSNLFPYKLSHKFLPLQVPPLQMVTFANFHLCKKPWLHKIYLYTHICIYQIHHSPYSSVSQPFSHFPRHSTPNFPILFSVIYKKKSTPNHIGDASLLSLIQLLFNFHCDLLNHFNQLLLVVIVVAYFWNDDCDGSDDLLRRI